MDPSSFFTAITCTPFPEELGGMPLLITAHSARELRGRLDEREQSTSLFGVGPNGRGASAETGDYGICISDCNAVSVVVTTFVFA